MKELYQYKMTKCLVFSMAIGLIGFLASVFIFPSTETPLANLYSFYRGAFKWGLLGILIFSGADDFIKSLAYHKNPDVDCSIPDGPYAWYLSAGIVFFAIGTLLCNRLLDYGLYREITVMLWPMFSLRLTGCLWVISEPLSIILDSAEVKNYIRFENESSNGR